MNEDAIRLVVNSETNNSSGGRLYGLDILRFLLAVEILMFHSRMHVGCSYGRLIDLFLHVGAVTMTTFFVLSGFVNEYAFGEMKFHEKGVIKKLRETHPEANIAAVDYDPGASEVNQLNRIKLMLSTAQKNLE